MSTYKVAVKCEINGQHLDPHTCQLEAGVECHLVNKIFLNRELLSSIERQQLQHIRILTKKPRLLDEIILFLLQIGDLVLVQIGDLVVGA